MDVLTFWMYYFLCCFYLSDWQDEHSLVIFFVCVSSVKNLPAMQEIACNSGDLGLILGLEDPLEEEMATSSSFLT